MIQLTEIAIRGQSNAGRFSGALTFSPGLQVISAPNAYGKSLAVTAVAWCLGAEPIFGLQNNDPACFPLAAREEIQLEGLPAARVLSSECSITVTHSDGRQLTLARDIVGDRAHVQAVERSADGIVKRSKLEARKGTMQDEHGGLQRFLFEWLHWPRHSVVTYDGTSAEIYLENLIPLFYIAQNEGWTDLQALQVGRYRQQQIAEIAVEYLLGALDAIDARVGRQRSVFREAALRETANTIAEAINSFVRRHGWNLEWSGRGLLADIVARWSASSLRDALKENADVDLFSRRKALESQVSALRDALTKGPIDPSEVSAAPAVSQRVVDLKQQRHGLNEELRTLRTQYQQFGELVSSLEHRLHSADDVLRLKTTGVGRLEHVECPTCHRDLDPATFSLTDQSQESVTAHIEALKKDRELMKSNLQAIDARLITTQAQIERVDGELRQAERALITVTAAVGTVREQLAKTAADLASAERALDETLEASAKIEEFQSTISSWLADARATQQASELKPDLKFRIGAFEQALREYLMALGHSAINPTNAPTLRVDENYRYTPYLDTRRLGSLGSASDRSRMVEAYTLALAAASNQIKGLHPGLVIMDEPLQQNPDEPHRKLFRAFLSKQLARESKFQTIVFTSLREEEIAELRLRGTRVVTPEGKHFLKREAMPTSKALPRQGS